jgi:SAM-dependent methyltransferase
MTSSAASQWALALFHRSVLKQQKWRAIHNMVGDTAGLRCLDIGSDNGVISYLLRAQGGRWTSADLDAQSVEAIRSVVGADVVQLNGARLPFADAQFARVVLVDCLEHVHDDRMFIREIARITLLGGEVVINVPVRQKGWLRRFRAAIGQTDEAHGHVRPGYTVDELRSLLGTRYELVSWTTYSKLFSELIDTVMTWGVQTVKRGSSAIGCKGAIVTSHDMSQNRRLFLLYSLLYPVVWCIAQLDRLLWFRSGSMLIAKTRVRAGNAS